MRYRDLGNTGLRVSEIGFGCWGIGGLSPGRTSYGPTDDRESLAALERALERGITFYDTSPAYGDGHSEELLGRALGGSRDRVVIASKVGYARFDAPPDFSPEAIARSLGGTLRRLGTDCLDLLQLHNPPTEVLERLDDVRPLIEKLHASGTIRVFGISVKSPEEAIQPIRACGVPVAQVNFNLIDQRAVDCGLFRIAREEGVGVIARTPFNFGFLTGAAPASFGDADHRKRWPAEQVERWRRAPMLFRPIAEQLGVTLPQLALAYCLSEPAVSTVIPGMLTAGEVEENIGAVSVALTAGTLADIRRIYAANRFF